MAKLHNIPHELVDNYYTGIGKIIFAWSQLEWRIMRIIWFALGLDPKKGRTLTVGMNSITLLGVLRTCNKRWIPDVLSNDISSLANDVSKYIPMRNAIAHGIWGHPYEAPQSIHLHYMKESDYRLMPASELITPSDLIDFGEIVLSLVARATQMDKRLHDALPGTPQLHTDDVPPNQDQIEPEQLTPPESLIQ